MFEALHLWGEDVTVWVRFQYFIGTHATTTHTNVSFHYSYVVSNWHTNPYGDGWRWTSKGTLTIAWKGDTCLN